MKRLKFLFALAIVALAQQAFAQQKSKITNATVFPNAAQIFEEATVTIAPGLNSFSISGLSQFADPASFTVEGNSNFEIQSVKSRRDYLADLTQNPEVKILQDELEEVQHKIKMRTALQDVYTQEQQLILANKNIKGNDAILLAEDLDEMAAYFRKQLTEIKYKFLELEEEQTELKDQERKLRDQLNVVNGRVQRYSTTLEVAYTGTKKANAKVKFNYMIIGRAGWSPAYDIRTEDIAQPLSVVHRGRVRQSTGVDWENVKLTLSTGTPSAGGQKPSLYPWYLYMQDPSAQRGIGQYDMMGKDGRSDNAPMIQADEEMVFENAAPLKGRNVEIQQQLVNAEFAITAPYDIPSDNQMYDVEIQESQLASNFEYFAVPKLDKDAFLVAITTDWRDKNFLAGPTNIYYKGTFVGKGFLDPSNVSDSLEISMGRDKAIIVEKKGIEEECKNTVFGSKRKVSKAYRITVRNNKRVAATINLQDQIPISQVGEIEVDTTEISGGSINEETGQIDWKMTLQPGERKEVIIKFEVKHPKKKVVPGL